MDQTKISPAPGGIGDGARKSHHQQGNADQPQVEYALNAPEKQRKSVFYEHATPEQIAHVHRMFKAKRAWSTRVWLNEDPTCPERYVLRRIAFNLGYDVTDPVSGCEVRYTSGHDRLRPFL
jgi:hypothetical protein